MPVPATVPLSAMLLKSVDTLDKILQYIAAATDALQDVADTTQIPFLDSVGTFSSTIIPIVQVRQSGSASHVESQWDFRL
jgi:hypothetical protein